MLVQVMLPVPICIIISKCTIYMIYIDSANSHPTCLANISNLMSHISCSYQSQVGDIKYSSMLVTASWLAHTGWKEAGEQPIDGKDVMTVLWLNLAEAALGTQKQVKVGHVTQFYASSYSSH